MDSQEPFEQVRSSRPGDAALRRKRKQKARLRVAQNISGVIQFFRILFTKTPFVPMFLILIVLWLIFSAGFYYAEHPENEFITSYGEALWWGMASIETMGTPYQPITTAGEVIGGIWAILGVVLFWGMIIASVTIYFAQRKEGGMKQIVSTIEYNLEQIDTLSLEELKVLKGTTDSLIDVHIQQRCQEV